jgi:hypothetical protein
MLNTNESKPINEKEKRKGMGWFCFISFLLKADEEEEKKGVIRGGGGKRSQGDDSSKRKISYIQRRQVYIERGREDIYVSRMRRKEEEW